MMFAGITLPSSLHYLRLFDPAANTVSLIDGAADALQRAVDTFDVAMRNLMRTQVTVSLPQAQHYALFDALGVVSAIHPHSNCPQCASGQGVPYTTQYDTLPEPAQAEATPIELFEWFMRNHSESKQIIVDRLRRDFNVLPRKKPGPEGI